MKVLHVINTLSAGGAELHLLTLCRHLKRQGVDVIVACLKEKVKGSRSLRFDFEKEEITVFNLGADRRFDPRCLFRLVSLLKRERPDLLHSHLPRADFAAIIAQRFYSSIPWVCSVHDIHSKSWSGKWTLPLFNWIWRRAYAVIAISNAVKTWLVKERSIPPEKVTVIYYGIEPEGLSQPNSNPRKTWGLDSQMIIGSIGRLEPRKGHETLIRALPEILKEVPNVSLLVAGHDPWGYNKTLQAMIDKLELNGQVRLVGFQSDVISFLHSIDVFAFASTSEGFGQVVIEAMAARKPVVVSNISPLTEIVVDGESGLLVDDNNPKAFSEAIIWLLENKEEARRIGEQGLKRVTEVFSAERMAVETINLYNRVISFKK